MFADISHERQQTLLRQERIAALQTQAQAWAGKLDGQDSGQASRGRKLSDSGAKARLSERDPYKYPKLRRLSNLL